MIPLLEPAQLPGAVIMGLFFAATLGIPTALLSSVLFYLLERVPSPLARRIAPAAGAILVFAVSLWLFIGQPSPGEDQTPRMILGFLSYALVILAPYPFLRHALRSYSPYFTIGCTALVVFFFLTCIGLVGGEIRMPLDAAEYQRENMIRSVTFFAGELIAATLTYAGIAALSAGLGRAAGRKG